MSAPQPRFERNSPQWDVEAVRADFSILQTTVNGKPLTYLDNAATTQKPRAMIEAVRSYYEESNANVHRGVHSLSVRATELYENAREAVRELVRAEDASEIVFTRGCTESLNLVAQSFARPRLRPGDLIVLTQLEHHSNIVPWQLVAKQTGATIRFVPVLDSGELDLVAFERALEEKPFLCAFTHASNVLGIANPVERMAQTAHEAGAFVVVDGAQAAPHRSIDVQRLGVDFYAISAHKAYGPTGIGALYGRRTLLDEMEPYQGGGDMILKVTESGSTYAPPPAKFEAGTPNIAGTVGWAATLDYLKSLGDGDLETALERIEAYEVALAQEAAKALNQLEGIRVLCPTSPSCGPLSFVVEGIHPHDVGTLLDSEGVAVRAGHHCAMPLMQRLQVPATVRASFAFYNTASEIERLCRALELAQRLFRGGAHV